MANKQAYDNESITSLKGADRVRKRPAVIFGSDGMEGCAHSITTRARIGTTGSCCSARCTQAASTRPGMIIMSSPWA